MLGKPDSLRELVLVTQRYDNLYWERQEEWKLARQRDNKPLMNANLWGPNSANPPATQVNEQILGPDSKLKLEECKCCQENNLCMMCGKPGHAMSTCPAAMRDRAANLQEPQDMPNTVQEESEVKDPSEPNQITCLAPLTTLSYVSFPYTFTTLFTS